MPFLANTRRKSKGAQEAHEAIRPTYLDQQEIDGSYTEKRLYELIWKRAIASQMSDASLEKTTITIDISTTPEKFLANGEVLKFEGFLKVYIESTDDENEEEKKIHACFHPCPTDRPYMQSQLKPHNDLRIILPDIQKLVW